jgi:hypothetical protein
MDHFKRLGASMKYLLFSSIKCLIFNSKKIIQSIITNIRISVSPAFELFGIVNESAKNPF